MQGGFSFFMQLPVYQSAWVDPGLGVGGTATADDPMHQTKLRAVVK
jgi:hypothetical protein